MFKIFVAVDKHQGFKSLTVKRNLLGLNIRPATLKMGLLIISKLLTISSNSGLRSPASQQSNVQLLIWNEINSDANIAAHLSIRPLVNGQQNLTGFVEIFYQYLVDHGWHARYQCCGEVLLTSSALFLCKYVISCI